MDSIKGLEMHVRHLDLPFSASAGITRCLTRPRTRAQLAYQYRAFPGAKENRVPPAGWLRVEMARQSRGAVPVAQLSGDECLDQSEDRSNAGHRGSSQGADVEGGAERENYYT